MSDRWEYGTILRRTDQAIREEATRPEEIAKARLMVIHDFGLDGFLGMALNETRYQRRLDIKPNWTKSGWMPVVDE